jgi:hypothetical protein
MVALLVSAAHASITSYHVPPLVAKAKGAGSLSECSATQKTNALGQHKTTGVMELEKTVMTLRGGGESISCVCEECAFSFTFWSGPQTNLRLRVASAFICMINYFLATCSLLTHTFTRARMHTLPT